MAGTEHKQREIGLALARVDEEQRILDQWQCPRADKVTRRRVEFLQFFGCVSKVCTIPTKAGHCWYSLGREYRPKEPLPESYILATFYADFTSVPCASELHAELAVEIYIPHS